MLYGFAACFAAFSDSLGAFLFFRCLTMMGVCVEFVAAITWLSELFPSAKQRESVLGVTQAFHCLGGLMVTGAYFLAVSCAEALPAIYGGHQAWRYTLLSGLFPAIPLFLVRPFYRNRRCGVRTVFPVSYADRSFRKYSSRLSGARR